MAFALLLGVASLVGLFYGSRSVFTLRRQRATVTVIAVVAFLLGAALAPLHRSVPALTQRVMLAAPTLPARNISSACKKRIFDNIPSDAAASIDDIVDTASRAPLRRGATLNRNEAITVVGWALNRDRKAIAAAVCLDVDGAIATEAHVLYGISRPDVASAFESPTAELSGYDIAVPQGLLGAGKHTIRLVVIDEDGSPSALTPQRRLFVW